MPRRTTPLALAVLFSVVGLVLAFRLSPDARLVQVLLPFAFGMVAGLNLGRWMEAPRASAPAA